MFAPSLFQLSPRRRRHERREHGPVARRGPEQRGRVRPARIGVRRVVRGIRRVCFFGEPRRVCFFGEPRREGPQEPFPQEPPPAEPPVVRREISKREVIAVLDVDDDDRLRAHVLSHDVRRDGVEVPAVDEKITVVPHGG